MPVGNQGGTLPFGRNLQRSRGGHRSPGRCTSPEVPFRRRSKGVNGLQNAGPGPGGPRSARRAHRLRGYRQRRQMPDIRDPPIQARKGKMKRLQQGFTLIELMTVVAIVGILAAIALAVYPDYATRAKMSEAVAAADACKTSLSAYVSTRNGTWPTSVADSGCSTMASQYVASLDVGSSGIISVATRDTGSQPGDCTLVLTPSGTAPDITAWVASHSGCDAKYVPSNFR